MGSVVGEVQAAPHVDLGAEVEGGLGGGIGGGEDADGVYVVSEAHCVRSAGSAGQVAVGVPGPRDGGHGEEEAAQVVVGELDAGGGLNQAVPLGRHV